MSIALVYFTILIKLKANDCFAIYWVDKKVIPARPAVSSWSPLGTKWEQNFPLVHTFM